MMEGWLQKFVFNRILITCLFFGFTLAGCGGGETQISETSGQAAGTTATDTGTTTGTNSSTGTFVGSTNPGDYKWVTLSVGEKVYIDRNFTYTDIPPAFNNYLVLQTANDDKSSAGDSFVSFDITQTTTVYVAHVSNDASAPAWLDESWTLLDEIIGNSDRDFFVYSKEFTAGTVVLGGNEGAASMYVVLLANAEANAGTSPAPTAACDTCADGVPLKLTWDANADEISGYRVYFGDTETTVNMEVKDIPLTSSDFNPMVPSVSFDAGQDLKLNYGDKACFSIKAYNGVGSSLSSDVVCTII